MSVTPAAVSAARSSRTRQLWLATLVVGLVIALDQLTKAWAITHISEYAIIPVWGNFLRFSLVYNQGGAMGTNLGGPIYYLFAGGAILIALMYYIWAYAREWRMLYPLALIAGGAIGNLIDRLRHGHVIDFIDVDFFDIRIFGLHIERWWTFNLADSAITIALVFIVWQSFFSHSSPVEPHREPPISGLPSADESSQPSETPEN